jgi:pimeloyl-ACP methyl ester carboxylesterase
MTARLRQVLVSTALVVLVLLLAGATYQGVATALERRRYPHPGQLVDVGGHQLHIHCLGEGAPTVVLEASAAAMSAAWGWVQPAIAKTTRVCAYDRAGLGWSEAGDRPYDPGRVPEELHTLLATTKQPRPYVLAGHSLGASFVRRFAGLYPAETAGIVVVEVADDAARHAALFTASPWLARAGLLRATRLLSDRWEGLPAASAGAMRTFLHRPDHLTRAARELARWDDAVRLGREATVLPGVSVRTVRANPNHEGEAGEVAAAILEQVAAIRARP